MQRKEKSIDCEFTASTNDTNTLFTSDNKSELIPVGSLVKRNSLDSKEGSVNENYIKKDKEIKNKKDFDKSFNDFKANLISNKEMPSKESILYSLDEQEHIEWNQFEVNEQKFKVKSKYHEEIYNTNIDHKLIPVS